MDGINRCWEPKTPRVIHLLKMWRFNYFGARRTVSLHDSVNLRTFCARRDIPRVITITFATLQLIVILPGRMKTELCLGHREIFRLLDVCKLCALLVSQCGVTMKDPVVQRLIIEREFDKYGVGQKLSLLIYFI